MHFLSLPPPQHSSRYPTVSRKQSYLRVLGVYFQVYFCCLLHLPSLFSPISPAPHHFIQRMLHPLSSSTCIRSACTCSCTLSHSHSPAFYCASTIAQPRASDPAENENRPHSRFHRACLLARKLGCVGVMDFTEKLSRPKDVIWR